MKNKKFTLLMGFMLFFKLYGIKELTQFNNSKNNKIEILSKGINLGYRAGLDRKHNELLAGYYFNFVTKYHTLITFDNDIWTNFKIVGINSSISYSSDFLSFSYYTDFFHNKKQIRAVPSLGIGFGINDLISFGFYYHQKFKSEIEYPTFTFKLMLRPSFINILAQNSDGSKW